MKRPLVLLFFCLATPTVAVAETRFVAPNPQTGASAAVVVENGPLIHTAQLIPTVSPDAETKDAKVQTRQLLERLQAMLEERRSSLSQVVKLNVYLTGADLAKEVQIVLADSYRDHQPPAVSFVVTRLPKEHAAVALDAVATVSPTPASAKAATLHTHSAILPVGKRIYVSGQAKSGATLAEATRKTLAGLQSTLRHLDRRDTDVVQVKAFFQPMTQAEIVRKEVAKVFGRKPLVLVEWKSSGRAPIEIELVAWGGARGKGERLTFVTPPGVSSSPVFSRIAVVDHDAVIYTSGLYAAGAANSTGSPNAAKEVAQVFGSLDAILKRAGSDFRHLAKATYYVSNPDVSKQLNVARPTYYDPQRPPAASKAMVSHVGKEGRGLTLDMIAVPKP